MNLTQEQIEKLAINLSKIKVNGEKTSNDINWILKYIELLNEIDTTWVQATVSVINTQNKLRKDIEKEKYISKNDLLNCSNQKIIADQIAINKIMK